MPQGIRGLCRTGKETVLKDSVLENYPKMK